jgi:hypothetical protein
VRGPGTGNKKVGRMTVAECWVNRVVKPDPGHLDAEYVQKSTGAILEPKISILPSRIKKSI